jgi:hypothetical protein
MSVNQSHLTEAAAAAKNRERNLANPTPARPPAVANDIRRAPAREYRPDRPCVASRAFTWHEHDFTADAIVDWRAAGITETQLRGLWAGCYIDFPEEK